MVCINLLYVYKHGRSGIQANEFIRYICISSRCNCSNAITRVSSSSWTWPISTVTSSWSLGLIRQCFEQCNKNWNIHVGTINDAIARMTCCLRLKPVTRGNIYSPRSVEPILCGYLIRFKPTRIGQSSIGKNLRPPRAANVAGEKILFNNLIA